MLVPLKLRRKHCGHRKDFFSNPASRPMGKGRDLFAIRKDGTQFPVEIGLSTIETDSGIAVLSSIIDITERKNAEKILQDSEEKLQAILDNTTDSILVYDEDGKIIKVNNQARDLFTKNEEKLENISNIIPPDQISIHQFQLDKAKNGTNLLDYETERILSNGERIFVSVALSYMPREDGMYIETTRDISERVIMRNKIIDFEKAQIIANMAEGIAHHMGTPLASMLLRVQMLKEDMETFDAKYKFQDKLESIENQILYGQKVMQRLLKFASKPISEKVPINIKNIAKDAIEMLRPLLNKKRIKSVIEIDKDYKVLADSNLIQLVFSDLIINSIDAIEDKGIIKITANKDESNEKLTIKISDTGTGIPEEVIPYVFEPFYTTKTAEKGTGLGLAVAKRIVQEHDGEIRIESKKNEGTDIIINLPLYKGVKNIE
jgi:PAS domain S-box-containing protein